MPALRQGEAELNVPDDPGVRGAGVQLLSPAGTAAEPFEFGWSSPVRAAAFRVEVFGGDQRAVFSATVADERLRMPDELLLRLTAGVSYSWRATALDARGEPILQSEVRSFVVPARRP